MNQYPNYDYQNYDFYQGYTMPTPQPPVKLSRVRWHVCIIALAVVMVTVATTVAQAIIYGAVYEYFPALAENDWFMIIASTVPIHLFGMPVAYLLLLTVPKSAPQRRRLNPLMWVGFLCLCFTLSVAANVAGQYFSDWITFLLGIKVENEVQEITSVTPLGVNILVVGLLAPIFEELFYRKAIIDRLRRYGDLPAILISGVIFGLMHGNFSQVFYTTAIGILLGYIYLKTGNVFYTISLHMAYNIIGGV